MQAVAEKPGRLVLHPGWVAFAALALAVPVGALFFRRSIAPDLPMLGELPAFSLVAEDGKPFGRDDLLGRVWVADFVFTSCSDACPRLQAKMKKLQDRLVPLEQGGNIGLLSISVDPERDPPQRLKEYGGTFGARRGLWRSLTGEQTEVERTVVRGFHIAMAKMAPEDADPRQAAFDIMHGERLVLVDRMGRIGGYYDADDGDRLPRDARALTAGGAGDRRLAFWMFPVWACVRAGDRRRRILDALPIACIEDGHGVSHHRDLHRLHGLREAVSHRRDHRRAQGFAHHLAGALHRLRRLRAGLPGRRHPRPVRKRAAHAEEERAPARFRVRAGVHRLREVRRAVPVRGAGDGAREGPEQLPRRGQRDREELHRLPRMREGLPLRRHLHLPEGPGPGLAEELHRGKGRVGESAFHLKTIAAYPRLRRGSG